MIYKHLMLLLGAGATFLSGCSPADNAQPATAAAAQSVSVMSVRYDDAFSQTQTLTGQVEANRHSDVGFELSGLVATVFADEGDSVDQGQALATLASERLLARRAETDAQLQQTITAASLADATFARIEEALSFDGVSRQEFDEARNTRDNARAAVLAARARLQSIDVDIAKSTLLAPFDAVITARHADEGQVLAPGQRVLSLQERGRLSVRVGVAGSALDSLVPDSAHTLRINDKWVEANVRQRLPQRDRVSRTVDVLFDLPPDDSIRAGDLARLEVTQNRAQAGVWLPLDALAEGSRGLWTVYVAIEETQRDLGATHKVQQRPVNVVYQDGNRAYVDGALTDGDAVVVSGLQRIVPGQAVRLIDQAPQT
ncbi:MAG: efflux RND transporter periplasmic adaptor subunit [Gammaproteobacteria bacterium]